MVAGALVSNGAVDVDAELTHYVPALANSGYAGATVRHLLDMRSGITFSEDYLDPMAEVRLIEQAIGWAPRTVPDLPTTMYDFLRHACNRSRRTAGRSSTGPVRPTSSAGSARRPADCAMPELMSQVLWAKLGARQDATIGVDSVGTGMFDGGINACLSRSGQIRFAVSQWRYVADR